LEARADTFRPDLSDSVIQAGLSARAHSLQFNQKSTNCILRFNIPLSLRPVKNQTVDRIRKDKRYARLYRQIKELIEKSSNNSLSNMATLVAVLHHKMDYFFWTGFYLLQNGKLQVGPYQGSLACINLEKNTGVCWAAINKSDTVVVEDVHIFSGHIACDSRSQSEIVVPLKDKNGQIVGVLDVDSSAYNSFDEMDAQWLKKIVELVFHP
jgi:GAF domain-containing protein